MKYPLVRDVVAEGFPVRLTFGALDIAAQSYCHWLQAPICQRDFDNAYLVADLRNRPHDDLIFG